MKEEPTQETLAEKILQLTREKKPETTSQLIDQVHEQIPSASNDEILAQIIRLQEQGKLVIKTLPPLTQPLSGYLKTSESSWFWVTIATTIIAIACTLTIPENDYPLVIIRYVFGTALVLWLPGYTFLKALYPEHPSIRTGDKDLDTIERIALSIGLSLALVPIVGLLLNYTPWGIALTSIVLSLSALTIVFASAAIIRQWQNRTKKKPEKS